MSAKRQTGYFSVVNVQPIAARASLGEGMSGAFVVTLAIAGSEAHFKELVISEFEKDGFSVIGWDEISPFNLGINDWHSEETRELHEYLCDEHPVQYSRFDAYPRDGLDA